MPYLDLLESLLKTPTAPYREHWMMARVMEVLAGIPGMEVRTDAWGNIAAHLVIGEPMGPPVAFVSHLDHPGFLVDGVVDAEGLLPVLFEGGVRDEFFPGAAVRLFRSADDAGVRATVVSMDGQSIDARRNRRGFVRPEGDCAGAVLGMWDLAPMRVEGDLVHSRAADDLGGTAAILAMLGRLAAEQKPCSAIAVFTRAEEAGFRGALMICRDPRRDVLLPSNAVVISVETSSQRPHVPVGGGAVLRVGDKSSVFDPEMCANLGEASRRAAERAGRRPLVRALMDGGSCEATAFNLFGYRAAGVCVPLGNYHNMDLAAGRIAEEFISLSDAEDLIESMKELCQMSVTGESERTKMRERFVEFANDAEARLRE